MGNEIRDSGLLYSGNDLLQAFERVVLCLLSAGHGAMDGHFLSVDVTEQESNLCSHVCLMGILEFTMQEFISKQTDSVTLTQTQILNKNIWRQLKKRLIFHRAPAYIKNV